MNALKIIQITDLHLSANKSTLIHDINTYESAQRIINTIKDKHNDLNALVLTGDLVMDESHEGYEHLSVLLKPIGCPIFLVPGNHDSLTEIQWLSEKPNFYNDNFMVYNHWIIFMFNSKKNGALEGALDEQEIFNFEQLLGIYPEKNFLIFVHHPLVKIDSDWMDGMRIENPEKVKNLIENNSNVKAVSSGHVHQEHVVQLGNTQIFTTPSTCYQFKPHAKKFALDHSTNPGYRVFDLEDDGILKSEVIRVNNKL
ncbi:MAG: hypothetical protein CMD49_00825 [Gammaproteobacteria bacterium]|nr:hypothetical protein [Gammaproteobacteria bacterium]